MNTINTESQEVGTDIHNLGTFSDGPLYYFWNSLRTRAGSVVYLPNNTDAGMVNRKQGAEGNLDPIPGMYHILDSKIIHEISGDVQAEVFSAAMRPGGVFSFLPGGAELVFPFFLINQDPQRIDDSQTTTEDVNILVNEGRAHTALRGTASAAMTRGAVKELGNRMGSYSGFTSLVLEEKINSGESFDLVDLFGIVPHNTVADLLGVASWDTQEGWDKRLELAEIVADMGAYDDPERALNAQIALFGYAAELIASHRQEDGNQGSNKNTGDGGIRDLVTTLIDGTNRFPGLSDETLLPYYLLVLFAGNETTRNALVGSAEPILSNDENRKIVGNIIATATNNEESIQDALSGRNKKLEALINEMLRYVSPVQVFTREVLQDTELNGVSLKAGDVVALQYGAANHNPETYENPEEFRPLRFMEEDVPEHVAFGGHGPHHCIGQQLARSEMRRSILELFPVLIKAVDSGQYRIGEVVRKPDLFLAGFQRLDFVSQA